MVTYLPDARRYNRASTSPYHPSAAAAATAAAYHSRDRRVPMIMTQEPDMEETQSSRKRIAVAVSSDTVSSLQHTW